MIALSIRQPWAWLIVNGFKDIENRSWRRDRRGPILIHAGQVLERDAAEALWAGHHPVTGRRCAINAPRNFPLGGIVGEAEIMDCVTRHESPWFVGPHGFVLAKARPLPFQPCRGALGFFAPALPPRRRTVRHAREPLVRHRPAQCLGREGEMRCPRTPRLNGPRRHGTRSRVAR